MRPYLAVIVDSFRAAFASRVLWVALIAIYLFLLVLAPIGYQEVFTTTFRWPDIANGTRMKAMLARAIQEPEEAATPPGCIARSLPPELQDNLRKVAQGQEVRIRLDILAEGLNTLYQSDAWYDAELWRATTQVRELRELEGLAEQELTEQLRQRRARLRIEAALPGVFESRGSRSISLTYAGFSFPMIFEIEKAQFQLLLNHFALRMIIDWVLGFALIFLGILVTAAIIPDMLQPGSLHLLLSKPVSRHWLFLAKFAGGCAFVLVCVSQLILGLWLISGLRLDVWNARLLWCIPVCVFLFAVFYSVSAVAGLRWRSPVLAIGLANLFGAACLLIGFAGWLADTFISEPDRVTGLATAGETIIASTRGGHLRRYDPASNRWVNLLPDDTGRKDRVLPPVTLDDGRVVSARVRGGRINPFGSGATPLLLLTPSAVTAPEPSIELPAGTGELYATADGLLALNAGDLMLADPAVLIPQSEQAADAEQAAAGQGQPQRDDSPLAAWLPRLIKMMGGPSDGFRSILPPGISLISPHSVAIDAGGKRLFIYSGGKLLRLDRAAAAQPPATEAAAAQGPALPGPGPQTSAPQTAAAQVAAPQPAPQTEAEAEGPTWRLTAQGESVVAGRGAWLRVLGDRLVLLRSDEPPLFFDASLQPLQPAGNAIAALSGKKIVAAVSCQPLGAVAVLLGDGKVWLLSQDPQRRVIAEPLSERGAVEALHWDAAAERLWLAHRIDAVAAWELARSGGGAGHVIAARPVLRHRPAVSGWRMVDRYVVTPLRFVTPQTGELGETIASIISGQDTLPLPLSDLTDEIVYRYNVWRPVLTCGGFIVVMLAVGCVYFSRIDF